MKHLIFLCFLIVGWSARGQQSSVRGIISIHNSEVETGKRQYVINAQVEDKSNKAQPTLSDEGGSFKLIYVGIAEKKSISFNVKKAGLQVVNIDALTAVAGQYEVISVSMAVPDRIESYRRKLYEIGKSEAEQRAQNEITKLKKALALLQTNSTLNAEKIKNLEKELIKREEQKKQIDQQADDLSQRYARINLDETSAPFKKAFRLFQAGKLDSALFLLQEMNLPIKSDSILTEREKIKAEFEQEYNDSVKRKALQIASGKLEEQSVIAKMMLRLMVDLYKIKFEFDSASKYYELLLQLDPSNPKTLFDYATFLEWRHLYDKAKVYYEKALAGYQRVTRHSPLLFSEDMAIIQEKLSRIYRRSKNSTLAEGSYLEAVRLRRQLTLTDSLRYGPALALMQYNFGENYYFDNELGKAESAFHESLDIYRRLARQNSYYETFVAMLQASLGKIYAKKNDFPKAESLLLEQLESNRQLARSDPKKYNPSVLTALGHLGVLYANNKVFSKAEAFYLEELAMAKKLAETDSQGYRYGIAWIYKNLGSVYQQMNRFQEAENAFWASLAIFQILEKTSQGSNDEWIALILDDLSHIYHQSPNISKEEDCLIKLFKVRIKLQKRSPEIYSRFLTHTTERLLSLYSSILTSTSLAEFDQYHFTEIETELNNHAVSNPVLVRKLSGLYGTLSWYQIKNSRFIDAERSARSGLKISPTTTINKTYLAHALLFQEKYERAMQIYREIKPLKNEQGNSFGLVCLSDLEELKKDGLNNKYLENVLSALKIN